MNRELEATVVEAMDALEAGEPLEEILERYPRQAAELRPLLETAAALADVPVAYSAEARQTSREAFLRRAAELGKRRRSAVVPWWRSFALAFGSLALLLIIVGGLLVGPAAGALPGDALYPLKLAGEEARLSLAGSPAQRDTLRERYRRERVSEINTLLALGREAEVSCYGALQAIEEGAWLLDDLHVEITDTTQIQGEPVLGAEAEGRCHVADGQVTAVTMRVHSAPELPPPTLMPTATTEPTVSETPAPSSTVTATPAPTESLTPPAESIGTPTPPPAGAPGDDGDDDREGDDDDDDDSDHGDDDDDDDEDDDDA